MGDEMEQPKDPVREDRFWSEEGWTAKVVKNEDGDGWAVEMYRDGEQEVALVGPWTMGRDKKNPKPLDKNAFMTLVKTAGEFVGRVVQQQRARLHRELEVGEFPHRTIVHLDVVPDEEYPYAILRAYDESGNELAKVQVDANFKLGEASAKKWVDAGFRLKGSE